ncbi:MULTISPECIES: MFS transporter [Nocardia]|uniref:MFS transporter n=1 Tax=Nocardia TaxID=1817 RepID=UPI000BF02ABF|nr:MULTISPECIES: MFS transporter [Nocardia]MBF6187097.1 MFS transporter [Nocardia farcinica]MBF6312745.1 MFS transporter [Nocardia farcinica]MBF6408400.1 MFS transporter [Nocardia farcinica]PEH78869.1 MFS transporter [Nocardia sp. FDAARGOS_372]UEX23487.1 MFS transporter [Nocardia farcinica]
MTTPRDPYGPERGPWDDEETPPIERHPGYDRYPPPNAPTRRRRPLPPLDPDRYTAPPPLRPLGKRGGPPEHDPGTRGSTSRVDKPVRRTSPQLPPATDAVDEQAETGPGAPRMPRKLTVTRVAAMRSRQLTEKGIATFQRAAKADGADKSGLTALTYATMANFALDAAIAVALANTLFFASATAESKSKVALYLLITIAPFAVIAPLIGPLLDRLQRGRRLALATSFAVRAVLAVVLILEFDTWALYPLALCMMIGSKSFSVLKSAVTPRVLPPEIDLVRTNSRLTVFGLVGGTMGAGSVAALVAALAGSTGALVLAGLIAAGGAYLSLRIPRWVEVTEGEVPATLTYRGDDTRTEVLAPGAESAVPPRKRRQPLGRAVVSGLWGNGTIRVLTGFLTFYVAFVAKATEHRPLQQATMLGVVGAAAAIGNFTGNATGARIPLGRPSVIVIGCTSACAAVALFAVFTDNLLGAAVAALVAAAASALAKVSLDASIQDDLPPESIASGFGRSETVLQLSWVIGGAAGVLLPTDYWKGFAVVSGILVLGLIQTFLSYRGHSLLPGLGGNRPQHAEQEVPAAHTARGQTTTSRPATGDPIRE